LSRQTLSRKTGIVIPVIVPRLNAAKVIVSGGRKVAPMVNVDQKADQRLDRKVGLNLVEARVVRRRNFAATGIARQGHRVSVDQASLQGRVLTSAAMAIGRKVHDLKPLARLLDQAVEVRAVVTMRSKLGSRA
jgi:hypothetical protein